MSRHFCTNRLAIWPRCYHCGIRMGIGTGWLAGGVWSEYVNQSIRPIHWLQRLDCPVNDRYAVNNGELRCYSRVQSLISIYCNRKIKYLPIFPIFANNYARARVCVFKSLYYCIISELKDITHPSKMQFTLTISRNRPLDSNTSDQTVNLLKS